jgi:hypothetical protein
VPGSAADPVRGGSVGDEGCELEEVAELEIGNAGWGLEGWRDNGRERGGTNLVEADVWMGFEPVFEAPKATNVVLGRWRGRVRDRPARP